MSYLLDTCIVSKLRKLTIHPDPDLQHWIEKHDESLYFLSVLTIGEIQKGIHKLKEAKEKRVLEDWLYGKLIPRFENRILEIDIDIATQWGELTGKYAQKGESLPTIDSLLAATSIRHHLIFVTDNLKDFSRITELKLFSPWEKTSSKH